jgi:hypothetical protein
MMRFLLLLALIVFANPARAANDDSISYEVKRGDTLIGIGKRYLARDTDYLKVQKANSIRNDRAVPVGTKIRIARGLLKFQPSNARVVAIRGNVTVERGSTSGAASNGAVLGEGATVRTAASSFATLSLENGSRVSLPSNSDLKIVRLRRYLIDSSIDYDFAVGRGGASSKVTPAKNPNDRYVVKTPKAVSAVRGTDFQSRYDPDSDQDFSEVVEGGLAVTSGDKQLALPAGNGLAVSKAGVITEALLPPVDAKGAGKLQNNKMVKFALQIGNGISGMRVSLGSDAGFVEQVADVVVKNEAVEFADIADGNYFVRFRALSANGKWLTEGKGIIRYHFQLFQGKPEGVAMVDEAGLTEQQVSLSDLPAGDYFWRVGSVQYLDAEVSTNWTDFEKLTVGAE